MNARVSIRVDANLSRATLGEPLRGPQVSFGYWNQPKDTRDTFLEFDGHTFFRTGDLGYYHEEGYFFITDRLKRMINASRGKVTPEDVIEWAKEKMAAYKYPRVGNRYVNCHIESPGIEAAFWRYCGGFSAMPR